MKIKSVLFCVSFFVANSSHSQIFTGALKTDADTYKRIGEAPSPIGSDIPASVDLSLDMPPVGSQSPQNSCVAWAVAYANYSYINKKSQGCNYILNSQNNKSCIFSPSFIYNQINGGRNVGTSFVDAFHIMETQGVAPLSSMDYIPQNWWIQPTEEAKQVAANYKIGSYWQLGKSGEDFFTETKAWLAKGFPVIAAVKVDNYLKNQGNFSVPYVWNTFSGTIENMGHAILIVGYNDNTNTFKFINSYGLNWGNSGYGYISYNMYKKVLNEAFILKLKGGTEKIDIIQSREDKTLNNVDLNAGLNFKVDNVQHFQFPPNYYPSPQELFSKYMTFNGRLSIPAGVGRTAQVAIYFYLNNKGKKGLFITSINPQTRTLKGQAVTATPLVNVSDNSISSTFYAQMRYGDLNIQRGYPYPPIQTNMIAEPVLLIDGFPVRIGDPHFFFVRM